MSSKSPKSAFIVGIDGRFYGPRGKGLGRYVQKLVDALQNFSPCGGSPVRGQFLISNFQFIIFLKKENWDDFQPINPNFKKVLADYKWYGFLEQILFPIKIWRHKIDLMHFPHFNAPIFCPCEFVVTIHDLILRRFPTKRGGLHSIVYPLKKLFYSVVIRSAVKKAKKVIAVSDFTKNDILKNFQTKEEKIITIYEGSPQIAARSSELEIENCLPAEALALPKPSAKRRSAQAGKLGIQSPYVLYVGNAYPHKNLERLVRAFTLLNQESRLRQDFRLHPSDFGGQVGGQAGIRNYDYKLVLAGEVDYFYNRLKKFVHNSKFIIPDSVIFTDFVSDRKLDALYKNASLYVFPSLYEGFGLPPLEAMARGAPVVSSDQTAIPEILGDAALYFNPYSVEDMAEKMKMILADKTLKEKLIEKGFERIKRYSWEKMGKETIGVYRGVFGNIKY